MQRLSAATLGHVPAGVRRPRYDRGALGIGMAHIGVGAFHRCHQAEYTDDALEAEFGAWGVVGINLRPPRLAESLAPQDGLFTRTLRGEAQAEPRLIGCIKAALDAEEDMEAALAALADPRIGIATLTVTEKGYCHRPATGQLDAAHADVVADLLPGAVPRSLPGVLVAAMDRRRREGRGGLTLVSCDNIPANGRVLAAVVGAFAAQKQPDLGAWIADNVRFPSTMVDRIVPATAERDLAFAAQACGLEDHAAVAGEPFRQWVIEDHFAGPRPGWEAGGAEFVADVTGHELIKMRVLNAAQSALSYLGALAGLDYTYEDVRDPVLAGFVRAMLVEETVPCLPRVAGMDVAAYIELTFRRLHNTAIVHGNHQIATDGSQKMVQRILNPIRDRIAAGAGYGRLAAAAAAWMAYLCAASPRFGARWTASDPWAATVRALADATGPDAAALTRRILAIEPVFGTDLRADKALCDTIARHLDGFLRGNARRVVEPLIAGGGGR